MILDKTQYTHFIFSMKVTDSIVSFYLDTIWHFLTEKVAESLSIEW